MASAWSRWGSKLSTLWTEQPKSTSPQLPPDEEEMTSSRSPDSTSATPGDQSSGSIADASSAAFEATSQDDSTSGEEQLEFVTESTWGVALDEEGASDVRPTTCFWSSAIVLWKETRSRLEIIFREHVNTLLACTACLPFNLAGNSDRD